MVKPLPEIYKHYKMLEMHVNFEKRITVDEIYPKKTPPPHPKKIIIIMITINIKYNVEYLT